MPIFFECVISLGMILELDNQTDRIRFNVTVQPRDHENATDANFSSNCTQKYFEVIGLPEKEPTEGPPQIGACVSPLFQWNDAKRQAFFTT